jgi:hypothetical protein
MRASIRQLCKNIVAHVGEPAQASRTARIDHEQQPHEPLITIEVIA